MYEPWSHPYSQGLLSRFIKSIPLKGICLPKMLANFDFLQLVPLEFSVLGTLANYCKPLHGYALKKGEYEVF